jgi:hypothetical protein
MLDLEYIALLLQRRPHLDGLCACRAPPRTRHRCERSARRLACLVRRADPARTHDRPGGSARRPDDRRSSQHSAPSQPSRARRTVAELGSRAGLSRAPFTRPVHRRGRTGSTSMLHGHRARPTRRCGSGVRANDVEQPAVRRAQQRHSLRPARTESARRGRRLPLERAGSADVAAGCPRRVHEGLDRGGDAVGMVGHANAELRARAAQRAVGDAGPAPRWPVPRRSSPSGSSRPPVERRGSSPWRSWSSRSRAPWPWRSCRRYAVSGWRPRHQWGPSRPPGPGRRPRTCRIRWSSGSAFRSPPGRPNATAHGSSVYGQSCSRRISCPFPESADQREAVRRMAIGWRCPA